MTGRAARREDRPPADRPGAGHRCRPTTDTYLAALPQVRASLPTTDAVAQLTATSFLVGLAAGQLLLGPVIAPAVGGVVLQVGGQVGGWREVFASLAVLADARFRGPVLVQRLAPAGFVHIGGHPWPGPGGAPMALMMAVLLVAAVVASRVTAP